MNKIIYAFFILTFSIVNTHSASFNWKKIGTNGENDTDWYYDPKTAIKVGNYRYYWTLANFLSNIEDDIYSSIGHHMVNCSTYESKFITYSGYNSPMGRGDLVYDYIIPEESLEYFYWIYADPKEDIYGVLLKEVCK